MERERKLHTLASKCDEAECSSGFLTPNDSLVSSPAASTGTNYSNGSSRHSCGSSGGSRSYLPDRLQIVKPLEGKSLNFIVLPCFYNYLLQSLLCSINYVERKLKRCCWSCVSTLVSTVASRFGSDSLGSRGFACSPRVFVGALRVLQLPPQTSIWSYMATVKRPQVWT